MSQSYILNMGIFTLWLMWRNNKLLDQIRRGQLTPAERAAEEKEEQASSTAGGILLGLVILIVIVIAALNGGLH
jgi:hypothetical protein